MLTEADRAAVEAEVDRDLAFERAGVPQCAGCKQPRPWDEHGQCRHCGRFAQGRKDTRGYVYLFECVDFVKIGMSYNVDERLKSLQEANPFPVVLVSSFRTWHPHKDEHRLHRALAKYRHKGEWFRLDEGFKKDLAAVVHKYFGEGVNYGYL